MYQVRGSLGLDPSRKKQWAQLGFDAHGLRLQLHFLRAADDGYHLIHVRATQPMAQTLELTFTGADGKVCTVHARGRGVALQNPFKVDDADGGVRVPRRCRARASLSAGDVTYDVDETALSLGAENQVTRGGRSHAIPR